MRLFVTEDTFISVIKTDYGFSCQVMNLVNGFGMYPLSILDSQIDAVSCVVHEHSKRCSTMEEVAEYQLEMFKYFLEKNLVIE